MQGLGFTAELEPFTHQSDDGTLGSELCGTEQRPDEAVDLLLLRVVFVIISRNLRLLRQTPEKIRMKLNQIVSQSGITNCCLIHQLISECRGLVLLDMGRKTKGLCKI